MQFGLENNHSTVLCIAVYIETVNHYMNEASYVYSCLIDTSKNFDSYISQKACVTWAVFRYQYFLFKNGVKQGGILSPILFTMYVDKLLVVLRTSGIWCHIGSAYNGALSYADDITLLCPSIRG